MKTLILILAVAFIFSPQVRDTTANTLYSIARIIDSNR